MQLRDYQESVIHDLQCSWRSGHKRPCIVLPCGGGKSIIAAEIAKRTTDNRGNVMFLVHRQELCEQISSTFAGYGVDMTRCSVNMVQTASRRSRSSDPPKLIITDENHHCVAGTYRKIYESYPESYCVGLTATPVRLNGGGLGEINDDLITGPTVKQLIERKCLAPFDYYAPAVADLSGIRSRAGDYSAESVEEVLAKPTIYGDVIRYYDEISRGQAICYCATIKHSTETAAAFRQAGISAEHIDGKTPAAERSDIIHRFRSGEIKVLCNVDLISEGFDVPDCNTAILLRPTKSLTLFIQQSMRCMRYQPDKRAIILDHVGNVFRHGLPDQDREWSLDPKKSGGSKKNEFHVRQCPECYYTHETAAECPKCGYVYQVERKSAKEVREAKLQKISETVQSYKKPDECRTFAELAAYGKHKGYKAGWAYHQGKQRGLIR